MSSDFSQKFQDLKIKETQDINILLLGETGVGKSTFVNSIANYFHYKSFKKAFKAPELLVLIPSAITVTNEKFEQVRIKFGSDKNEFQEIGAAATQDVKTYVFPIGEGKTRLRLIDSPGMGDPRGIEQDDINCEHILAYLAQLKELHAICFLMKPITTRKTVYFEYCVKQILSRLEKSASNNIIFIFTNTRGTDYTPGETLPCLKTVIDDIKAKPPHVNIPLKDNIFSLDNEAFRYLVAMKNGVTFDASTQDRFNESWITSSKECWKLISYIIGDGSRDGLKPHQLLNTVSINEARRIIVQLSQPLAEIAQLIHDNIRILDRHQLNLRMDNQSLDQLKKKLYIPVIDLQVTLLTQPVTVCTSTKCAELVQVGEVKKWHYCQRCHDPCYLTNVTKEIVGDPNLQSCAAMNGTRTCVKCTCDFSVHMHVYYMTKTVDSKLEDQVVKANIHKKEQAVEQSLRLMRQIDQRKKELEEERGVIIKSTAQFAHFLQHNAISPFNDSYKAYIEYLISREKSLGRHGDPEVVHSMEELLRQYEQIKEAFETSLQSNQQLGLEPLVTAQTVWKTIHSLYQLKHNGKKIHEILKKQKASRNAEYDKNCEYIHPKTSDVSQSEGKKDKSKNEKKKGSKTDDDGKNKAKKDEGKNKAKKDEGKNKAKKDEGNNKAKKKDGRSTDDERNPNNRPGQYNNRNFEPRQRNRSDGHPPPSNPPQWRDPPPPYDSTRNYQQGGAPHKKKEDEPNIVVKVELGRSGNNQKGVPGPNPQEQNQHGHAPYSSGYNYGPPYPGPTLHAPPAGPYYNPPYQGPHYGPPQNQYQGYYGPPQGPYHGPPQGPYHGPAQGPYPGPPQGPYAGPPQGAYQGPPPQGHYNRHYSGPPNAQGYNQGGRGRPYNRRGGGGGGKRSQSQPRLSKKDGKSGNEKSRSSDSDSSSD